MRIISILVIALIFGSTAAGAGVLDRVAESQTLRIGFRTDAPPFSYEQEPGKAAGYSVTICKAVADTLKADLNLPAIGIRYIPVTAENRFEALRNGEIDLLCGPTSATLTRRQIVDFSLPIFVDGAGLMIAEDVQISSLGELAGKKLGVRAGTTTERAVRATFPGANITAIEDHAEGMEALKAGQLEAYFADRTLLAFMRHQDPEASGLRIADEYLSVEPYALALPRGDSGFRLAVDQTISRLMRNGQIHEIAKEAFGSADLSSLVKALYRITPLPE